MNGIPDGLFVSIGGARGSEVVVALYGERDIASAPVLSSVLPGVIASGTGPLVLELGPLSFIDCAGISARWRRRLLPADRQLVVRHPTAYIFKGFVLVGLTGLAGLEVEPINRTESGRTSQARRSAQWR